MYKIEQNVQEEADKKGVSNPLHAGVTVGDVLKLFMHQKFYRWYHVGNFDAWVAGDPGCMSDYDIAKELHDMILRNKQQ